MVYRTILRLNPDQSAEVHFKDLAGKTAFVTGAASGIGLRIAAALAQAGVKVMLCNIEETAPTKAVADLKLTNADVDGVKADVSLKGGLQAAADVTVARYGKAHILVNNAGIGGGSSYRRWTDASWNVTIGVNLMSQVWMLSDDWSPLRALPRSSVLHEMSIMLLLRPP